MFSNTLPARRQGIGLPSRLGLAMCMSLVCAGCANQMVSQSSRDIALSDSMLANAVQVEAPRYAPEEVVAARIEIEGARRAYDQGDYDMARLMAMEAQADATVAESKARNARAQASITALQANMQALRADINRPQ
jgi:hypothetical protein